MIAVLVGCHVPFVPRKSADRKFEIVGKAYVDRIMDDEAVVECESVGLLSCIKVQSRILGELLGRGLFMVRLGLEVR
jgi:hypothetical protein